MKIRKIALAIALAATLSVAPALSACTSDTYSSLKFDPQDTTYAVTSQGGNAVGYGKYVYFVNGTAGYDDDTAIANTWPDVVKGGVYRAELSGADKTVTDDDGKTYKTFEPTLDVESGLEFKFSDDTDYFDKPIKVVDVTPIAHKTVGTAGYSQGGLFIYDNYLFFATPHNQKSATGAVQSKRTDFFLMPLSGGSPKKIYTTAAGVDTSSSAYAFYKLNDAVYLVVHEGGDIITVRINANTGKVGEPQKYEVNATSVYFPVRDIYYDGIDNNTAEDFIYFIRNVRDDEPKPVSGTVMEAMRPDGSEQFVIDKNGQEEKIIAVRDGVLFYQTTMAGNKTLAYNSLHSDLTEHSPTYSAAQAALEPGKRNRQFSGNFKGTTDVSSLDSVYPYHPKYSNEVFAIGASSSDISIYSTDGSVQTLCDSTGTILFTADNYLYYTGSTADFYRVPLSGGDVQKLADSTSSASLGSDYVAGYFTYFAKVDDWADGYTYFYKVDGREGLEPQFVGLRAEDDIPSEEELEKIKNGETDEDDSE